MHQKRIFETGLTVLRGSGSTNHRNRACYAPFILVTILAGIVGLGCSRDSTGPHKLDKMLAMNLFENPIADISLGSRGPRYGDTVTSEFSIVFPDSVFTAMGRVDDIWLFYTGPQACYSLDVSAYNIADESWDTIETRLGSTGCLVFSTWSRWLLSSFVHDPAGHFLDVGRTLRLRGDISSPLARLLRYRDDYAYVVISPESQHLPYYRSQKSLGFDGRCVWATIGDSVFIFDPSGERIRELCLPPGVALGGMAWSGTEFWVVEIENPPRISILSDDGTLTHAFTVPVQYWDTIRGGIAWADSLIWLPQNDGQFPNPPIMKMIAIDPVASLESNEAVVVREIPVPEVFRDMKGITSNEEGLIVVAGGTLSNRIYRMSLNGDVDEGRLIKLAAGHITWDGESIWMVHSGPSGAATDGSLLSRFTLQ